MAQLTLDEDNALYYDHTPVQGGGVTFVFFNALTGDASLWRTEVIPALHAQGHGSLLWNYRGQAHSPCASAQNLGAETVVADAVRLLDHLKPRKAVLVGLSIGGLFAARAYLAGAAATGLVFINTLRRPGPRLAWLNEAALRCASVGGMEMVKDLFGALIFNEQWLADNRAAAFKDQPYTPLAPDDGYYRLLADCRSADWQLPYERLQLPVLVISGLQDDMFLNLEDVQRYAKRLPDSRRIDLADAGHMVPLERPQAFNRALLDFAVSL